MRYETYQPKFHPRSIVFETEDEWNLFIAYVNQSDIPTDNPNYANLDEFSWKIYNLIHNGLEKI